MSAGIFGFLIFASPQAAIRFRSSEAPIVRVLRRQLAAYRQIKNEAAQAMNGFGRLNQSIEISEKKVDTHRSCG